MFQRAEAMAKIASEAFMTVKLCQLRNCYDTRRTHSPSFLRKAVLHVQASPVPETRLRKGEKTNCEQEIVIWTLDIYYAGNTRINALHVRRAVDASTRVRRGICGHHSGFEDVRSDLSLPRQVRYCVTVSRATARFLRIGRATLVTRG